MMKQTILYIMSLLLMVAGTFQVKGQELRAKPDDPKMPYLVTAAQPESGQGSFTLSNNVDANGLCLPGSTVTVTHAPASGYAVKADYLKVYKTGEAQTVVTATTAGNASTFTMPAYPVTVEVKYASTATALTGFSYTVGGGSSVTISPLPSAGGSADIELPWNTSPTATVAWTATCSAGATASPASVTLSGGLATATVTVRAEDGVTTSAYTFRFTTQKQITEGMVTLSATSFEYNASEQKPAVTVKEGQTPLEMGADKDYTLEWSAGIKNVKADYSVTVKPTNKTGRYGGNPVTKTFAITAKPLTAQFSAAVTKVYDGTTEVKGATLALVGVVEADKETVGLNGTPTMAYADANVGKTIVINLSALSLTGTAKDNYSVTTPTNLTGTITEKPLTVQFSAAVTKVYDGTTEVKGATLVLADVVEADKETVGLTGTPAMAYADKNVSADKTITISNMAELGLDGTPAANYSLPKEPVALKGAITAATLTVTPDPGQMVYADEVANYAPSYQVAGWVSGDEEIALTGQLQVGADGKVVQKDLSAGSNYSITVADASVTLLEGSTTEADVAWEVKDGEAGNDGWGKGAGASFVLKAPAGFLVKETVEPEPDPEPSPAPASRQSLRSGEADGYLEELVFTEEGEHTVYYLLKRNIPGGAETAVKSATYKLDASLPKVEVAPGKGTVSFNLADDVSGLASCSYQWDKGEVQTVADIVSGSKNASFSLPGSGGKHTFSLTLTDVAGNQRVLTDQEVTIESTGQPVLPTVYYSVTLPKLEGATTDPKAGDYTCLEGSSFSFKLALDEDYSESQPVVTLSNGKTLQPDASGGYRVRSIYEDIVVSVSGIKKNQPVANAVVSSATVLKVSGHALLLQLGRPSTLYIVTLSGRLWRMLPLPAGDSRVDGLPSGIYMIGLDSGEKWKVEIR